MKTKPCFSVAALVLAALVCSAAPAESVVLTFNNRAAWELAIGQPVSFFEDFSGFGVDTEFRSGAVDVGPFSLEEVGGDDFRNLIDVAPFQFGDNNGTTHASMFTNFGVTSVLMTLDSPLTAWGANFFSIDAEGLTLNFLGLGDSADVPSGTGFFGVIASGAFNGISFESRTEISGGTGEGFGLDDVAGGTVTVPEPTTLVLIGAAFLGLGLQRRRLSR